MHTSEVHSHEIHARKVHAHEMHACKVHAREMSYVEFSISGFSKNSTPPCRPDPLLPPLGCARVDGKQNASTLQFSSTTFTSSGMK